MGADAKGDPLRCEHCGAEIAPLYRMPHVVYYCSNACLQAAMAARGVIVE